MWERKRLFFKKRLLIRRCFKQLFDNVYSNKNIKEKKTLNINSFFFSSFIKFEFTLCVLLFRLGFFLSIPLAKKAVESRKITVNNIYKSYNYVLCEGDIIKINAIDQNLSIIQKSYMKTSCFIPNIEIDYYTGTLVIIKNPSLFTKEDISLMVAKHTDLSKLYWALYRN
jgi:ribosomal protein S4